MWLPYSEFVENLSDTDIAFDLGLQTDETKHLFVNKGHMSLTDLSEHCLSESSKTVQKNGCPAVRKGAIPIKGFTFKVAVPY